MTGLSRFYWHFIRQERWLVVALFVVGGLVAMLDLALPTFIGRVVALVSSQHAGHAAARRLAATGVNGGGSADRPAADVPRRSRSGEPDRQSRPVQPDPLAEPLARGAAKLDILPERLRRPHRQPRDADRAGVARKRGDGVRRRLVHHRVRHQRHAADGLHQLAAGRTNAGVVRRLRPDAALVRAAPARALASRVGNALAN